MTWAVVLIGIVIGLWTLLWPPVLKLFRGILPRTRPTDTLAAWVREQDLLDRDFLLEEFHRAGIYLEGELREMVSKSFQRDLERALIPGAVIPITRPGSLQQALMHAPQDQQFQARPMLTPEEQAAWHQAAIMARQHQNPFGGARGLFGGLGQGLGGIGSALGGLGGVLGQALARGGPARWGDKPGE